MAVLTIQYQGVAQKIDGQTIHLAPHYALVQRGPILQVTIGVARAIAEKLTADGKPVPAPISGTALIDTGATKTSIDESVVSALSLPTVGIGKLNSSSHAGVERTLHPISIELVGLVKGIACPQAMSVVLKGAHGLIAIIGRDILAKGCMFYNGKLGQFTISF